MPPKITKLATYIRDYEGKPGDLNYRNNNPGNCKFHFGGYLPKYGKVVEGERGFAKFQTYNLGWMYLQNLLLYWAKGIKADWTILELMAGKIQSNGKRKGGYAPKEDDNDPEAYARNLEIRLGIPAGTKLSELLK